MSWSDFDLACMRHALTLATQGEGCVEPNPLVGCVIANQGRIIAEGWHARFGQAHAEVAAMQACPPHELRGATAYVTLEPCCHHGKTPPCSTALIQAGIVRVVAAQCDPFPRVAGGGFEQLRAAGVPVEVGCCETEAQQLNAPYLHLLSRQQPWVIAKWAMSLDGKIATRTGHSRWISNPAAREIAHRLRGRVDAILIGRRTAELDDPLLTARPPGPRLATRIVLDSEAKLSLTSKLVLTAKEAPVLLFVGPAANGGAIDSLRAAGCEVARLSTTDRGEQCSEWLKLLGQRRITNLLVEGGSQLLGSLFDANLINELHVFIAPKLIGGEQAISPLAGRGLERVLDQSQLAHVAWQTLDDNLYCTARFKNH